MVNDRSSPPPDRDPFAVTLDTPPGRIAQAPSDLTIASPSPSAGDGPAGPTATRVGRYELLGEIARGGMGVVYRACDRTLNRIVALKVVRAGPAEPGAEARRFHAEAEAAAKLDHPHIVPIYEVGQADGWQFISMALVDGPSLSERVVAGPLPPREAAGLIRQVATAVAYAHAQGVVHRDLKPGNVLVDASGQPRVTDFGLAKRIDSDSSLTQAGQVMGTPNYMPPEQAEGKNDQVGPLSDVYSLGATLYCLVTGRPPFQSASVVDTLKQVVEREPASPHALNPAVGRDLETICLKCLQKRPDKRYPSATALAEDLQRYLDRRPILARPVGDIEKVLRWCRRNPLAAASLAGIAAIFLTAFGLVSWSYVRAEDARKDEAAQRSAADRARDDAERKEKAERWERYRANLLAAGSAMQLHNVSSARDSLEAAPPEHRNWEWHYFVHQLDTSRTVVAVGDRVQTIGLSPDGRVAAVQPAGPGSPGVQLWDLGTHRQTAALPADRPAATGFWFSADGAVLAYISADPGRIFVWDVAAGRDRGTLSVPEQLYGDVLGLSPDGARLVACCKDATVRVWDTATGRPLAVLRGHEVPAHRAVFSPDGRRVVSAGAADRTTRLWDARTGELLATLRGDGYVGNVAFNPQGDRVLTVEPYPSNALRLWEAATGKLVRVMTGHTNGVEAFAFSPDGTRIATGGIDRTIHLWDGRTGQELARREGHRDRVRSVGFSRDGRYLFSAGQDQTVRLFGAETGTPLGVLHGHTGLVDAAQYTADGTTLVTASAADGTVRLWDARAAERGGALRGHDSFVYDVAFHPDGERVGSVAWDGTARVWDATTGRELVRRQVPSAGPGDPPTLAGVAFHPDGELVATTGRDDAVRLWHLATGRDAHRLADERAFHARLAFSPRGDLLAAGGIDRAVHVWDVNRRAEVAVLRGLGALSNDVKFGPDGSWLAAAEQGGTVRVWDVARREPARALDGHAAQVFALAVSPDGRWLASAGSDGNVRVWDTSTWTGAGPLKHGTNVYGVAFSPDGTRLACACANNLIRLWDTRTFQLVAELDGHLDYVHQVAWSPDGTRLVSGSGDKTVRVWDSLSVQERAERSGAR